jgi:Ca2+-transporting ATPase
MNRPPRKSGESLFSDGIGYHILWVGILMAGITLGAQAWAMHAVPDNWQTIVFTILAFAQLGHVMAIRSARFYLFQQGVFSNLPLIGAVLLTIGLQLLVIYHPVGNELFKTKPLSMEELIACFGFAAVVFHAVEMEKLVKNMLRKLDDHS